MAALRRKRGDIPGSSITTSPIANGRSSRASTSCRCRCTRPRAGNGGWPPRASCSRSTRRSSSCSAAMPAMVTAPAARPHATAASTSSTRRGRPTSQVRATTARYRSRPTASSWTESCPRRSRATSTSTRRRKLQKFGLHNGEPNDRNNLSEKWEGMTLVPALDPANPNDYFLFVTNDNDFITQNGYQAGAPYKDASGLEVDTMILVYRITLPEQLK